MAEDFLRQFPDIKRNDAGQVFDRFRFARLLDIFTATASAVPSRFQSYCHSVAALDDVIRLQAKSIIRATTGLPAPDAQNAQNPYNLYPQARIAIENHGVRLQYIWSKDDT
jgi:hypothetical protein